MSELILFCGPGDVYRNMSEITAARTYTQMAIQEYDELVSFDDDYFEYIETPDFECRAGEKKPRFLNLSLFANQPMTRVGEVHVPFTSSSYLFNFNCRSDAKYFLPDLDIVQIEGNVQVKDAISTIQKFYKQHGWQTFIFDGKLDAMQTVQPTSDRFNNPIQIYDPQTLRQIANEKVGYSLTDLCFKPF